MAEKGKRIGVWAALRLVLSRRDVAEFLWLLARCLLDDGRLSHEEKTELRHRATTMLEDMLAGE